MINIDGTTINITRGDKGVITFTLEDEEKFAKGDILELSVYEKSKLDEEPVLTSSTIIAEETNFADIELTSEQTKIGDYINKPVTYWYEIELNGNQTLIGYDEDGAKEFILYPEGKEVDS